MTDTWKSVRGLLEELPTQVEDVDDALLVEAILMALRDTLCRLLGRASKNAPELPKLLEEVLEEMGDSRSFADLPEKIQGLVDLAASERYGELDEDAQASVNGDIEDVISDLQSLFDQLEERARLGLED